MKDETRKYFFWTLLSGILLLVTNFLTDFLFEKLWIFYLLPLFIFGLVFLVFFIMTITKKHKLGIIIGASIIGVFAVTIILDSELFKSDKLLKASLIDDLSAIHLTLRENKEFEVVASTVFTEETFVGKYEILDNKIIFKNKRYSNDFIPDTVYIIDNKVICQFDSNGNPVTEFASYFDIKKNEIKNEP